MQLVANAFCAKLRQNGMVRMAKIVRKMIGRNSPIRWAANMPRSSRGAGESILGAVPKDSIRCCAPTILLALFGAYGLRRKMQAMQPFTCKLEGDRIVDIGYGIPVLKARVPHSTRTAADNRWPGQSLQLTSNILVGDQASCSTDVFPCIDYTDTVGQGNQ